MVFNQRHLKRFVIDTVRYYHDDRAHLRLAKETPAGRDATKESSDSLKVIAMPRLGGLHHRYDVAA